MGGRKVCFIDMDGQVATCLRADENCKVCPSEETHNKSFAEYKHEISDKQFTLLHKIASLMNEYRDSSDDQNVVFAAVSFDSCCLKYVYNGVSFVEIYVK
jgi:hypothetical protein